MNPKGALEYAEGFGRFWESSGGNRGQGKILGWLLVCDPPHQSSQQLHEALHMSAGAVSTNTRLLEQLGMVERITFPRDRSTYFRIAPKAWELILDETLERIRRFRRMADDGIALLRGAPTARQRRLSDLAELLDFMESEYPELVARWHARKEPR